MIHLANLARRLRRIHLSGIYDKGGEVPIFHKLVKSFLSYVFREVDHPIDLSPEDAYIAITPSHIKTVFAAPHKDTPSKGFCFVPLKRRVLDRPPVTTTGSTSVAEGMHDVLGDMGGDDKITCPLCGRDDCEGNADDKKDWTLYRLPSSPVATIAVDLEAVPGKMCLTGTHTGRFDSKNPNQANFPPAPEKDDLPPVPYPLASPGVSVYEGRVCGQEDTGLTPTAPKYQAGEVVWWKVSDSGKECMQAPIAKVLYANGRHRYFTEEMLRAKAEQGDWLALGMGEERLSKTINALLPVTALALHLDGGLIVQAAVKTVQELPVTLEEACWHWHRHNATNDEWTALSALLYKQYAEMLKETFGPGTTTHPNDTVKIWLDNKSARTNIVSVWEHFAPKFEQVHFIDADTWFLTEDGAVRLVYTPSAAARFDLIYTESGVAAEQAPLVQGIPAVVKDPTR